MQHQDTWTPANLVAPPAKKKVVFAAQSQTSEKPKEVVEMESRVVELETHLEYIRRGMDEVRGEVKSTRHRLAYSAGGTAILLGLMGWIANSRFDQVVTLLMQ